MSRKDGGKVHSDPYFRWSIFVSEVAPSSQGTITMPGGAEQVIVPNRSQWTNPVQIDPSKL